MLNVFLTINIIIAFYNKSESKLSTIAPIIKLGLSPMSTKNFKKASQLNFEMTGSFYFPEAIFTCA